MVQMVRTAAAAFAGVLNYQISSVLHPVKTLTIVTKCRLVPFIRGLRIPVPNDLPNSLLILNATYLTCLDLSEQVKQ
jgi:hypothetical protein